MQKPHNSSKGFLFAVNILILLGAVPSICSAQDAASSNTYKSSYASVWKATIQALSDGGDSINNQDKESGTISTEWFVLKESALWERGWKVKENITVEKVSDDDTKVSIILLYQNKIGDAAWRPASSNNTYTPTIIKTFFDLVNKRLGN